MVKPIKEKGDSLPEAPVTVSPTDPVNETIQSPEPAALPVESRPIPSPGLIQPVQPTPEKKGVIELPAIPEPPLVAPVTVPKNGCPKCGSTALGIVAGGNRCNQCGHVFEGPTAERKYW